MERKDKDMMKQAGKIEAGEESEVNQNNTLNYYNRNAQRFVADTIFVDFESTQKRFMEKLPQGGSVLDFGCGSGRDTKYFLSKGYQVTAIDGSKELCKMASEYTGIKVKHMLFEELEECNQYDGIWACSSILHLTSEKLFEVLNKMIIALKEEGIIYTSFKYGNFEGERDGRYFTNMTAASLEKILQKIDSVRVEELWITSDVRPGRDEEKWINVILKKRK